MFAQHEVPTNASRGPGAVLDTLTSVIKGLASSLDRLEAVGVASAGQIHRETGAVVQAPNLGWRNVPLAATLSAALGVPVVVENDVRAAAWGEFRFGAHRVGSLLAVFVGTGLGSGAVLDGVLWTGAGNAAGELGHTRVVPEGLPCPCGGHGCLEQYASGSGFQRRFRTALAENAATVLRETTGGDPDALTAGMVAAAANGGDAFARRVWSDARRYLALGVANAVTLLNPEMLVLGGGVVEAVPELFDEVTGAILVDTTILARDSLRIERARLGDWAGVLGAAALSLPGGLRPPSGEGATPPRAPRPTLGAG